MKDVSLRSSPVAPRLRAAPGFTLIEMMIVVAIIAILASIAVASYDFAMVKARRNSAQGCLTEAAQFMERYYTTNLTYLGAAVPTCSTDVGAHYAFTFSVTPTATNYTLRAAPTGHQATAETKCGTMTVDQAGKRQPTTNCW